MNSRKLIVKVSYGLNALLIIAIVGILIYQQRLIRQIADNEQQVPQAAAISESKTLADNSLKPSPVTEGGREQLAAEVDDLRYQLEASEEELDMAREDLEKARSDGLPDMKEFAAQRKKSLENPAVRNMERRMQENMITQNYGALFEMLGLSDEKIQAFKTLMVNNQVEMEDMSLELMSQSVPEKERMEKMKLFSEQQDAEFETQARNLMGEENYKKYNNYQQRLTERFLVRQFISPADGEEGLSNEKEKELIDAMYEARKAVEAEYESDSSGDARLFIGVSSTDLEEGIGKQLEIYDRYIESARSVLSEPEAEQFATIIEGTKEMMNILAAEEPPFPSEDSDDEL